eukprot:scaffold3380_cov50-Attheya_sp.AAC.4
MEQVETFDLDLSVDAPPVGATPLPLVLSLLPGSTFPMFSTPLSACLVQWGGSGGLVTPIYCRAESDWCGGADGGSGRVRFRCRLPEECSTVAHHAKTKVVLKIDHGVYIQGPKSGQARRDLVVPIQLLRVPLGEFLDMHKALDMITAHFVHLLQPSRETSGSQSDAASQGSRESWVAVDEITVEEFNRARQTLCSPTKLKIGNLLAEMVVSALMGDQSSRIQLQFHYQERGRD